MHAYMCAIIVILYIYLYLCSSCTFVPMYLCSVHVHVAAYFHDSNFYLHHVPYKNDY